MSPGVPSLLQGSWAVRQDMMGGGEIVVACSCREGISNPLSSSIFSDWVGLEGCLSQQEKWKLASWWACLDSVPHPVLGFQLSELVLRAVRLLNYYGIQTE